MRLRITKDSHFLENYRLTRTFHPVGQGAFYSELFTNDKNGETLFSFVFDCGSRGGSKALKKQIDAFKENLRDSCIDLLIISHFHADHINGLTKLLEGVSVFKTVIPMLSDELILVARVQNYLQNDWKTAERIDHLFSQLYRNGERYFKLGEVVMVPPGSTDIPGFDPFWEYVSFNSVNDPDPRASLFKHKLQEIDVVDKYGHLIENKLKFGRYSCRAAIRKLYKEVMGDVNDNFYSLVVESRPREGITPCPDTRLSRCLYFGDFDSQKNDELWTKCMDAFQYTNIGTIQVPHHGSRDNWRSEMLHGGPHDYIISVGTNNTYHHPDYWVTQAIRVNNNNLKVVSEEKASCATYNFEFQ